MRKYLETKKNKKTNKQKKTKNKKQTPQFSKIHGTQQKQF